MPTSEAQRAPVSAADTVEYLAECFWPNVSAAEVHALDDRIAAVVEQFHDEGEDVRYLGSLLLTEDEVVFCRFVGSEAVVRRVAERAATPFERILRASHGGGTGRDTVASSAGDASPPRGR